MNLKDWFEHTLVHPDRKWKEPILQVLQSTRIITNSIVSIFSAVQTVCWIVYSYSADSVVRLNTSRECEA